MSDGVIVATPAGSTAYNLRLASVVTHCATDTCSKSAHGPIIPMDSKVCVYIVCCRKHVMHFDADCRSDASGSIPASTMERCSLQRVCTRLTQVVCLVTIGALIHAESDIRLEVLKHEKRPVR
jgi:hypothetical protein